MIYKKNSYINIVSFLLYLLPLALLTGPFLPDLIVTCASISFVYYSLKFKEKKYFKNYFFYFFSIMWIVFMSSSFLSENILISLKSSLAYIRHIIFIFLVYFIIDKNKKFLKKFNFYLIILLTLVVFDSIIQKSFGFNLFGFKSPHELKITSFLGDEPILGTYFLRIYSILFLINLMLNKNSNVLLGLFYVIIVPLVFYSGQRTIFYLSLLFIPFFLIFIHHNKYNILSLFILFGFLFYNFSFNESYKNRMITDITSNYSKFKPQNYSNDSKHKYFKFLFYSPHQTVLWITSLNMFFQNKMLGVGPNNFRYKCEEYKKIDDKEFDYCSSHPHNFLFQFLSETGLIGTILYIFFLLYVIKELLFLFLRKILRKQIDIPYAFVLFILIINFFPFVPNGNFFNNYLSIINLMPVPFLIYMINKKFNVK
jgi:O-antigen ligase